MSVFAFRPCRYSDYIESVRCYMCFMDDSLGGQEAVDEWEQLVTSIFKHQEASPKKVKLLPMNEDDTNCVFTMDEVRAAKREWKRFVSQAVIVVAAHSNVVHAY